MAKPAYAAIFGTGVWTIDLYIQLYSAANPDKIKPHPHVVVGFGIFGSLCLLYALIAWYLDRKSKPQAPESSSSSAKTQTARDINGKMFQADKIEYYEAPSAAVFAPAENLTKTPSEIPIDKPAEQLIQFGRLEHCTVRLLHGSFDRSDIGEDGVLLPVYNLVPKILPKGRDYSLAAHIVFYEGENIVANVARAYWLTRSYNDVSLKIGDSATIVLGVRHKSGLWTALANRFVRPTTVSFSGRTIPLSDKTILVVEQEIIAEVTLVGVYSGEVVARCSFSISPNGDDFPEVRIL
jgi:hypothetical protein